MVIDPNAAKQFISGYTVLLGRVHLLSGGARRVELIDMLASARDAIAAEPSLLDSAASSLEAEGQAVPEDVLRAVQSLNLRLWVFLRDTTKYSVFIESECKNAYAVLGLNQCPRDIVGGTGALIRTGVVHYHGKYVCDGILSNTVWIGANYMREYSAILASLKKTGRFHTG